jgi:hypothetical protein
MILQFLSDYGVMIFIGLVCMGIGGSGIIVGIGYLVARGKRLHCKDCIAQEQSSCKVCPYGYDTRYI